MSTELKSSYKGVSLLRYSGGHTRGFMIQVSGPGVYSATVSLDTGDCAKITAEEVAGIFNTLNVPYNEMAVLQLWNDLLRFALAPMNMQPDYD